MNIRTVAMLFAVTLAPVVSASAAPPFNPQDLVNQLNALTARVSKLEGNIVASDLAGTYDILGMDTSMTALHPGAPPIPATITTSAFRGKLTLNANGTGATAAGANSSCEGTTLTQGSWSLAGVDCNEAGADVTWTYANGVITINFLDDGDVIPFAVALGGRFLIVGAAPFHPGDPSSDSLLIIATRLQ